MTYHTWGDEWFQQNGDSLSAAERYIRKFVKRYSLGWYLVSKEKYGTLRYEHLFSYKRNYKWYNSVFGRLWKRYAAWILEIAIKRACKKYPEVKDEVMDEIIFGDDWKRYL